MEDIESMDPRDLAKHLQDIPPEALKKLDHALLYQAREYASKEDQNKLAAPEHQAFAREATTENPLLALPIALATLAYQPYKAFTQESRSNPSMDQVAAGLTGVGQGLSNYTASKMAAMKELLQKL